MRTKMAKMRFNRNFNISRVVQRLVYTILALYVGGTIITTFGTVMNCTSSPFYEGLSLVGWTITDGINGSSICNGLGNVVTNNVITSTSGAGVLAVVGIIGIASVVLEFVRW
jgi:hypothetical protein